MDFENEKLQDKLQEWWEALDLEQKNEAWILWQNNKPAENPTKNHILGELLAGLYKGGEDGFLERLCKK